MNDVQNEREEEMRMERQQLAAGWEDNADDYTWQLEPDVWVDDPDEWDEE